MKPRVLFATITVLSAAWPVAAQMPSRFQAFAAESAGVQVAARPVVNLTLDEAVARALERNLDIAVERLNPRTYDFAIAALEATYRPTLVSGFSNGTRITLPNSQLTGVTDKLETKITGWSTGLTQNWRWGGGSATLSFTNQRTDSSNVFAVRNPSYNTALSAVFVQPLLRGFRLDATRAQLRITRLNQEVSELQLKATITNTLATVRNAYWDLLYAKQFVAVARRSLELAEKLVADNKLRVELGTMAPIDVVQAEAEAAVRRQTLTQAEAAWRLAELALKRLIVSGTDDPLWQAEIEPVDRPTFAPEPIDVEAAIRRALAERTDLEQARRQLASNDVTVRQLVNQTLPALDVTATFGLTGLGGTQFERRGLGGAISAVIPGGYLDALRNLKNLDAPNWNVSLNLSVPLGTSAAEASVARARLQLQQTQAELKAMELQVATEVTNAALQVQSNLRRVEAATAARELAEKRLEAEQSKFEVGMSTNFFVVQAQRDLADAQTAELRALLDYRKSLVEFERVQQTALSRAGITLVSGASTAASPTVRGAGTTGTGSFSGGGGGPGGGGPGGN